ncbi:hypothetical protein ACLOJK_013502 [Asimina triloba]
MAAMNKQQMAPPKSVQAAKSIRQARHPASFYLTLGGPSNSTNNSVEQPDQNTQLTSHRRQQLTHYRPTNPIHDALNHTTVPGILDAYKMRERRGEMGVSKHQAEIAEGSEFKGEEGHSAMRVERKGMG